MASHFLFFISNMYVLIRKIVHEIKIKPDKFSVAKMISNSMISISFGSKSRKDVQEHIQSQDRAKVSMSLIFDIKM